MTMRDPAARDVIASHLSNTYPPTPTAYRRADEIVHALAMHGFEISPKPSLSVGEGAPADGK
jgi:hypothetical protein